MKEIFGIFGKKKNEKKEPVPIAEEDQAPEQAAPDKKLSPLAETGVEKLQGILSKMGFSPKIKAREDDQGILYLDMQGEEMGRLIGKEGATLNALQCLIGGILSKQKASRVLVKIDANDYRYRREQTLCRIAKDAAQMAVHQQKPVELEPMGANERRVIHAELSNRKDVHTYSTGERQSRRLIVAPGMAPENTESTQQEEAPVEENK
ncbi:RNA-binding cell elongation regulator Jag/EloR [Candidatus Margulisiibacteriota bacterium]